MKKAELLKKRDIEMITKFHELHDIKRLRIDDALSILSEKHFYLDTNYIYARIFYNKENNDYYNSLVEQTEQKKKGMFVESK